MRVFMTLQDTPRDIFDATWSGYRRRLRAAFTLFRHAIAICHRKITPKRAIAFAYIAARGQGAVPPTT